MARRGRSRVLVGFAVTMFLGVAVYFRLWAIQHSLASDDAELIRRQFDLANKEAMDESAEWRFRFDKEAERASKCAKELEVIKESFGKKEDSTSSDIRLKMLQTENVALLKQIETLKDELEAEKRRCRS
ncbi:hypothetical protein GQ457_06G008530 [Hibiscus cannabinus]